MSKNTTTWSIILENAEPISLLITSFEIIFTSIYGFIQIRNYSIQKSRETKWKQSETAWYATTELLESKEYKAISEILDIDGSCFEYEGIQVTVFHKDIDKIFRIENMSLTEQEIVIRKCMDRHAQNLSRIEFAIRDELFRFDQIENTISYDIAQMLNFNSIIEYMKYFHYDYAVSFVNRFSANRSASNDPR